MKRYYVSYTNGNYSICSASSSERAKEISEDGQHRVREVHEATEAEMAEYKRAGGFVWSMPGA